ncbi:hypothetical protein HDU90_004229 [Geranomyces variabilis]|nr:hypothetical protein HDU90_004229 [Geranomyces variabilis]
MTNLLRERVGGSGASFTSYIFLFLHPTIMARKGNKDDKKKKAAAKAAEAKNKLRNLAKSRAPNVAEMEEAARAQAQLYLKKAQRARCRKSHSDGTTLPRAPVVEEMEEAPLAQARLFMKKAQRLGAAKAIQMDQSYMSMKGIMFVLKRHKYRIADCQADLANLKAEHKTYFRKDTDEDDEDESEEEFESDDDMPLDKRFPPRGDGGGPSGAAGATRQTVEIS